MVAMDDLIKRFGDYIFATFKKFIIWSYDTVPENSKVILKNPNTQQISYNGLIMVTMYMY